MIICAYIFRIQKIYGLQPESNPQPWAYKEVMLPLRYRTGETRADIDIQKYLLILSKLAQMPPSGEETGCQNYSRQMVLPIWCRTKTDTSSWREASDCNFVFRVTRITFACSKMDITPRKRSKIIALKDQSSITMGDTTLQQLASANQVFQEF
ncbi:hypothetical protein TNCV_2665651 [Trichonephila clavipes]|nr:hypothetical protein TNCV_2665651 [Trichonephila clavipes]